MSLTVAILANAAADLLVLALLAYVMTRAARLDATPAAGSAAVAAGRGRRPAGASSGHAIATPRPALARAPRGPHAAPAGL